VAELNSVHVIPIHFMPWIESNSAVAEETGFPEQTKRPTWYSFSFFARSWENQQHRCTPALAIGRVNSFTSLPDWTSRKVDGQRYFAKGWFLTLPHFEFVARHTDRRLPEHFDLDQLHND
jgi:hypothetical protein